MRHSSCCRVAIVAAVVTLIHMDLLVSRVHAQPALVYANELRERPPFYKGAMPLHYKSAKRAFSMGMEIVDWHEFDEWRTTFAYEHLITLQSATAKDRASGKLLAEATLLDLDAKTRRMRFQEKHYSDNGAVVFECVSTYTIGRGYKIEETEKKGMKKQEYFFMLPL